MYIHTPEQVSALQTLFRRYQTIVASQTIVLDNLAPRCRSQGLLALCAEVISNHCAYPFDKLNRWLGFVQGVLAAVGAIDVDEEREFSRPLLHAFHTATPPSFAS